VFFGMENPEYYRSERFIWDNLKTQAGGALTSLYDTWRVERRIRPFIISWPGETILDDAGLPLQGTCLLDLPDSKSKWSETMRRFAARTKAYALLLAEQHPTEVLVILESHHGTRSWSIPILVSGDIRTLGTAVIKDNVHKIGLLWKTRSKAS
jgi:hypothetical protein